MRTLPGFIATLMGVNLSVEPLGEQELAYIRTEEFAKDDMLARLGLDLGLDVPDGGSLPKLALNIPPQPSEPSTPDPPFPLCNETAKALAEFDAMAYMAALDVPLPTSVGWEEGPRPSLHGSGVIDMSFAVPHTTPWSSWPEISANEGLNSQGSATNALSPEIVIPTLSQQLFLGPQDHAINSNPTSLQPPQTGRPRARTVPTVFREVTPDPAPSFPLGSPISVPHTPHNLFSSEGGSSTSSSPFSQSHDLPPCGNHPSSSFNPRFRSASVSTASRGRPLTRPRGIVERALNPARVRAHLPTHTDLSQGPTPGGVSSTSQHLDVPSSDWFCGGSDVSDYVPDSPSTPSNLSRASSTSSVHRRPRSHSRSNTPYTKPSSGVTVGDGSIGNLGPGNSSPERPKPNKNRKRNGREEFPGQRLHFDEQFMETVLGDNLALRMLLDNVLRSSWRKDHILEPSYGAQDDGVSQGLNLPIEPGSSVLLAFVHKTGDEHTCILCREVVSPRIPRQLGHVRGHIDLRPFPCTGCDSCDPKYVLCCPSFCS